MKNKGLRLIACTIFFLGIASGAFGAEYGGAPYISAHSAVLLDTETGEILYAREAQVQRPPASTTKIMTAILALEMGEREELVTVSAKAAAVGEASLYLHEGDKIRLGELLEGALVRSGNDACVAIGEHIAGSEEAFVHLMNQKAVAIGARNTHFENPNGLPAEQHYTTARDLALMARYALQNEFFAAIVQEKYGEVSFEEPARLQSIKNTNRILWEYPAATGVKTGTTTAAGKCLVASAEKEGRQLICVVLNAPDRFGDAQRLLEWGFAQTEAVRWGNQGDLFAVYSEGGGFTLLELGESASFCIPAGQKKFLRTRLAADKGKLDFYLGETLWREIPLLLHRMETEKAGFPEKERIN